METPVFKSNQFIDIDLYRAGPILQFPVYAFGVVKQKILLGIAYLDLLSNSLSISDKCNLPLYNCSEDNAYISISYEFLPLNYSLIQFKDLVGPTLNIFLTYSPPIPDFDTLPVTIKCFYPLGNFYILSKPGDDFASIGYSTDLIDDPRNWVRGPSGPTQVLRIPLNKFKLNKQPIFYIDSTNYEGIVTVNFLLAEFEDYKKTAYRMNKNGGGRHSAQFWYIPVSNRKTSLFHQSQIQIHPNTSAVFPDIPIYGEGIMGRSSSLCFNPLPRAITRQENETENDFVFKIKQERNMPNSTPIHLLSLTNNIKISSFEREFNQNPITKLHFYNGGSDKVTCGDGETYVFAEQMILPFNKNTKQMDTQLLKMLNENPLKVHVSIMEKLPDIPSISRTSLQFRNELDLEAYGPDYVYIYSIRTDSFASLSNLQSPPYVAIVDPNTQKVLVRNYICPEMNPELCTAVTLFRIEFIDNEWLIIPFRKEYQNYKKMETELEIICQNNWNFPHTANLPDIILTDEDFQLVNLE